MFCHISEANTLPVFSPALGVAAAADTRLRCPLPRLGAAMLGALSPCLYYLLLHVMWAALTFAFYSGDFYSLLSYPFIRFFSSWFDLLLQPLFASYVRFGFSLVWLLRSSPLLFLISPSTSTSVIRVILHVIALMFFTIFLKPFSHTFRNSKALLPFVLLKS